MKIFIIFVVVGLTNAAVYRKDKLFGPASRSDYITHLPGLETMPDFNMFSGYLDASENKKLHYWLNECVGECDSLIVWFNGGPGCSSMDGFLTENGPFKFHPVTGRLIPNHYSWNRLGHTLYIESPAGVGFSYDDSPNISPLNDDTTADDSFEALTHFFKKFQNLSSVDIYISGESYAGVYIPMLASRIIQSQSEMKDRLKGLLIGNGLLNSDINDNSLIYFAYYHGLFGPSLWNNLVKYCCNSGRPNECAFHKHTRDDCMIWVANVLHVTTNDGINMYNIFDKCAPTEYQQMMQYDIPFFNSAHRQNSTGKWLMRNRRSLTNNFGLVPRCSNASLTTNYLNLPEVQDALHVRRTNWELCDEGVNDRYKKQYHDMTPFIKQVLDDVSTDVRILLYFGDVDMACNFLGGEWFVDQLGYKLKTTRRKWITIADDGSEQVAGFYKDYTKITYLTVKGAGHMVPTDKPEISFDMLERFMLEEPFLS